MRDAYEVVCQLEAALCSYAGSRFAVTTNSCTSALLLACAYARALIVPNKEGVTTIPRVSVPRSTYVSVPMSVRHAGFTVGFRNEDWLGQYQLTPLPVIDSARLFTSGMCRGTPGQFVCVSFHASKTLGDTQGGAILHDNPQADLWLRKARFDGRTEGVAPKDDNFEMLGHHVYMSNDVAARLLLRLHSLPRHNKPLPNDEYPDLSTMEIFR